jgi:hypothetical protein
MKKICGIFESIDGGVPPEQSFVRLRLSEDATVIATGERIEGERREITLSLDESGQILPDSEMWANDELHPAGTYYSVESENGRYINEFLVPHGASEEGTYFGYVTIAGDPPIDISKLPILGAEPKPEPVFVRPVRRSSPAVRRSGVNYTGFVGGIIHPPSTVGVCPMPRLEAAGFIKPSGEFGVHCFTLPFKAVVTRVSVNVETPRMGRQVVVGLYRADGEKLCAATIDVSKPDVATGEFGGEVTLPAGELYLAWSQQSGDGVKLSSIGANQGQWELANAAGGGIVLGTVLVPNRTAGLPDKLGSINPTTSFVPPLTWFKA